MWFFHNYGIVIYSVTYKGALNSFMWNCAAFQFCMRTSNVVDWFQRYRLWWAAVARGSRPAQAHGVWPHRQHRSWRWPRLGQGVVQVTHPTQGDGSRREAFRCSSHQTDDKTRRFWSSILVYLHQMSSAPSWLCFCVVGFRAAENGMKCRIYTLSTSCLKCCLSRKLMCR